MLCVLLVSILIIITTTIIIIIIIIIIIFFMGIYIYIYTIFYRNFAYFINQISLKKIHHGKEIAQ